MRAGIGGWRNERGVTVVLLAVILFAMLALAAFSIDLASLRSARGEAQRAADAIALAGASAFRDFPSDQAYTSDSARTRGIAIARLNRVRSDTLDVRNPVVTTNAYAWGSVYVVQTNQVTLNIIPDSQKVRAWVRHAGVGTFFGGMLAKPYGHVQAMAAAWASNSAPIVNCLKPFLIPDMWYESNKTQQDKNKNNYMEPYDLKNGGGEDWLYQPPSISGNDYYLKFDPNVPNDPNHPQTGYGSNLRDAGSIQGDLGREILIKPQQGSNARQGNWYFLLDGSENNVRDQIKYGCINAAVGDKPTFEPGGNSGPASDGIQYLYDLDPGATWDPSTKQIKGSSYSDWTKSPRVMVVGLMDPVYVAANSKNDKANTDNMQFNNFIRVFIDYRPKNNQDNITALFMGFAPGSGGSTNPGTLIKQLQLIQ